MKRRHSARAAPAAVGALREALVSGRGPGRACVRRGTHRDSSCASALPRLARSARKKEPESPGDGEAAGFIDFCGERNKKRACAGTRRLAAQLCAVCGAMPEV